MIFLKGLYGLSKNTLMLNRMEKVWIRQGQSTKMRGHNAVTSAHLRTSLTLTRPCTSVCNPLLNMDVYDSIANRKLLFSKKLLVPHLQFDE